MSAPLPPIPQRLERIAPYTPIEPYEVLSERLGFAPEDITKMDANENPYGVSPKTRQALAELSYAHIYPDPESRALRQALSDFTGVPVPYLMAGSGADELLDLILRAYLEPGEKVAICPPTFGMYSFDTLVNTGQVVEIPRNADFSLDLPALLQTIKTEQPKVLFVTRPNNPDGGMPSAEEMQALLDLPLLVVVDEAYIEFTTEGGRLGEKLSLIREVEKRSNLVVLRTFSKWAGLAGLRVGYSAFPQWLITALWKIKQPYNVNVAGTQAALASLADLDWLAGNAALLREERTRLFNTLQGISYLSPFPSETNFILCRVSGRSAAELKNSLAQKGVLVRYYTSKGLSDCIRVSVGRPQDTDRLIKALEELP
jgi:histidinol-phosphate aminotransferase